MRNFDEIVMEFESRLEPERGYGWCSWNAPNPLACIDANCGNEEKLREKKPLMRLIQAMGEKAAKIGWETEYGAILEVVSKYLHHVHGFLLVKDDPKQEVANDPSNLTYTINALGELKEKLNTLKGFDKASMDRRIDHAIEWCSSRREHLAKSAVSPPSRAATTRPSTGCAVALLLCLTTVATVAVMVLYS